MLGSYALALESLCWCCVVTKEATLRVDGHFHCDLSIDSKDLHRHIRPALTFDG